MPSKPKKQQGYVIITVEMPGTGIFCPDSDAQSHRLNSAEIISGFNKRRAWCHTHFHSLLDWLFLLSHELGSQVPFPHPCLAIPEACASLCSLVILQTNVERSSYSRETPRTVNTHTADQTHDNGQFERHTPGTREKRLSHSDIEGSREIKFELRWNTYKATGFNWLI